MKNHLNSVVRYFILLFLFVLSYASFGASPKAVNGILNLKEYDLNKEKPLLLNGEWEFYWNELRNPGSFASNNEGESIINVPNAWTNSKLPNGDRIPGTGFATYRLRIALAENNNQLAIKIPTTGTSARIFVNGEEELNLGITETTAAESEAEYRPQVIDFIQSSDTLEIIVQISNYDYHKGGMWHAFMLGSEGALRNKHERDLFLGLFILGAIFIMGLYHLGLYIQRKQEIWNLWFAIANLIAGIRVAASGEYIISLIGDTPWQLIMRLELASFFFGIGIILVYLKSLFNTEMNRYPYWAGVLTSLLFGLAAVFLPSLYSSLLVFPFQLFSFFALLYCLYVVVLAVKHKRPGSKVFATGFLVLTLFITNDILLNMNQIYSIPMTGIGFILFLLSQSYLLAAKYTSTLASNEQLTIELDQTNKGLEQQVLDRTQELEQSLEELNRRQLVIQEKNNELEVANNTRTKLFGIIGHDLRGPLGSLQLALKNVEEDLEEGDMEEDELKTTVHVLSKSANKTFTLLNNLFDWAKSQTEGIHYSPEEVKINELIMNSLSLLKDALDEKQIISSTTVDPDVRAFCDRNMIDTVCRNLISNAIKFTPFGGKISIIAEVSEADNEVQISISDTGVGISQERIQDIFDYDRKKSTLGTNNEAGTGIGLALCKEFVEKNHGRITVDSAEGRGSTFIFSLPEHNPML